MRIQNALGVGMKEKPKGADATDTKTRMKFLSIAKVSGQGRRTGVESRFFLDMMTRVFLESLGPGTVFPVFEVSLQEKAGMARP